MVSERELGNIGAVSLKELIGLQNEGGRNYQNFVNSAFPGREFAKIRYRFTMRRPSDREKDARISQEYMGLIRQSLNEQDKNLAELQENVKRSYNNLLDAQNKFEKAKKKLEDSNIFVLVHPSATLNQLKSNKDGIFVSTQKDKRLLENAGCVDAVFDSNREENFVESIPYYMLNELLVEELKNYIAYANMVINFYLQGKDFVAIFASKEISDLLESNGYEIS